MFKRSHAVGAVQDFKKRILDNMLRLRRETGMNELVFPVGIFLVLDRANGGNSIADELLRRFNLIDAESRDIIDFFFLGWSRSQSDPGLLVFDLQAFQACRTALLNSGVVAFGGYADLLLFDVWLKNDRVFLDFEHAMHIDLAECVSSRRVPNVGGLLEGLLHSAEEIRSDVRHDSSVVLRISDQLGLATAKSSVLHFVLEKWGKIVGANSLLPLATRRLGPCVDLAQV
jgi:hypothetical protein